MRFELLTLVAAKPSSNTAQNATPKKFQEPPPGSGSPRPPTLLYSPRFHPSTVSYRSYLHHGDNSLPGGRRQQCFQGASILRSEITCGPFSDRLQDKEKPMAVRTANILAARGMYRCWECSGVRC